MNLIIITNLLSFCSLTAYYGGFELVGRYGRNRSKECLQIVVVEESSITLYIVIIILFTL